MANRFQEAIRAIESANAANTLRSTLEFVKAETERVDNLQKQRSDLDAQIRDLGSKRKQIEDEIDLAEKTVAEAREYLVQLTDYAYSSSPKITPHDEVKKALQGAGSQQG